MYFYDLKQKCLFKAENKTKKHYQQPSGKLREHNLRENSDFDTVKIMIVKVALIQSQFSMRYN